MNLRWTIVSRVPLRLSCQHKNRQAEIEEHSEFHLFLIKVVNQIGLQLEDVRSSADCAVQKAERFLTAGDPAGFKDNGWFDRVKVILDRRDTQ